MQNKVNWANIAALLSNFDSACEMHVQAFILYFIMDKEHNWLQWTFFFKSRNHSLPWMIRQFLIPLVRQTTAHHLLCWEGDPWPIPFQKPEECLRHSPQSIRTKMSHHKCALYITHHRAMPSDSNCFINAHLFFNYIFLGKISNTFQIFVYCIL